MDIRSMQQHNLTERGREEFNKFSDLNHHYHQEYCTKYPLFMVHLWAVYTSVCLSNK